jgi:hypothetical protein
MPLNENVDNIEATEDEIIAEEISLGNSVIFKIGDREITFWQLLLIIVIFFILVK